MTPPAPAPLPLTDADLATLRRVHASPVGDPDVRRLVACVDVLRERAIAAECDRDELRAAVDGATAFEREVADVVGAYCDVDGHGRIYQDRAGILGAARTLEEWGREYAGALGALWGKRPIGVPLVCAVEDLIKDLATAESALRQAQTRSAVERAVLDAARQFRREYASAAGVSDETDVTFTEAVAALEEVTRG